MIRSNLVTPTAGYSAGRWVKPGSDSRCVTNEFSGDKRIGVAVFAKGAPSVGYPGKVRELTQGGGNYQRAMVCLNQNVFGLGLAPCVTHIDPGNPTQQINEAYVYMVVDWPISTKVYTADLNVAPWHGSAANMMNGFHRGWFGPTWEVPAGHSSYTIGSGTEIDYIMGSKTGGPPTLRVSNATRDCRRAQHKSDHCHIRANVVFQV